MKELNVNLFLEEIERIISLIDRSSLTNGLKKNYIQSVLWFSRNAKARNNFILKINLINSKLKFKENKVIFVPLSDYYTVIREAKSVKLKEWYPLLLFCFNNMLLEDVTKDNIFELIITAKEFFLTILFCAFLDVDLIHIRAWMHQYGKAGLLSMLFGKKVIVESMDIPEFFAPFDKYKWIFNKEEAINDFNGIKMICSSARSFLVPYSKNVIDYFYNKYNPKAEIISWFNYTNKDNYIEREVSYSKPHKLVWAGSTLPSSFPRYYYCSKALLEMIIELTRQKIKIDFFFPPVCYDRVFSNEHREKYLDLLYEDQFNPLFKIIRGKSPNEITSELSKYHFGVFPLIMKDRYTPMFEEVIPTKFALYLEAGLPVLVPSSMKYLANIVTTHNLGIVFEETDIVKCDEILTSISEESYYEMRKSVINFRNRFSYEHNIDKLISLYDR